MFYLYHKQHMKPSCYLDLTDFCHIENLYNFYNRFNSVIIIKIVSFFFFKRHYAHRILFKRIEIVSLAFTFFL